MTGSTSGQDELILQPDWLLEQAISAYLYIAHSGYPCLVRHEKNSLFHKILFQRFYRPQAQKNLSTLTIYYY